MRFCLPVSVLTAVLVAACSSTPVSAPPSFSSSPTVGAPAPASPATATRVAVRLTDALRIEPSSIDVAKGQPVTFVVTNAGSVEHEFFLGAEAEQVAHENEMAGMPGMMHDEEMGIGVKPGATKELTVTFAEAGTVLAGCHVNSHYGAGMKASINVSA